MDTVIISGVTGQLGSYFVDYLLENTDLNIIGTVRRLSVPNYSNISHIKDSRFSLETMDLTDQVSITNIIKTVQPKYFINAAANSFVGSSWKLPLQHFDVNALGVLRILEAIKDYSPTTRFYNFGSSEEWGDVEYSPQDEKHPARARSPYGASKIAARQIVKVYRDSYKLYAIQGWSLNYESERRGEEFVTRKITKGVARIKKAIEEGKEFKPIELGNLSAKRDWSHALDIVDGVWKMLNQQEYKEEVFKADFPENLRSGVGLFFFKSFEPKEYVLSSGENHSIREFIELAFQVAGIKGTWSFNGTQGNYVPPENEVYRYRGNVLVKINPEFYRPADVETLCGNSETIKKDLGWKPQIPFTELVKRMLENDLNIEASNSSKPS